MRILVVEDEKKIASFIRRGLKEEGYAVDLASDGEQAHEMASTNDYNLILLDLMIPKLDGMTVCKKLREDKVETPILMLTAKDDVKNRVDGLDSGADDYLTKPFAFEELLARVRAHLRKKNNSEVTKYQVGDLTLDLLKHRVERAGREIPLSAKEFALLEFLMRHAGNVVTRTMIAEQVWDIHFDTSSNVIDVYINYLRSKINEGHKKKLIETVRGRGYVLKE
jgi:heavy metal response regulator